MSTTNHSPVQLISVTPNAEQLIAYCARVSNPKNQDNPDNEKLIRYLIKHQHWSPLEMAHVVMSIETTRAIGAQILRHRSFSFQEFSQRYADVSSIQFAKPPALRRQDTKNRQNSIDDLDDATKAQLDHGERVTELMKQKQYKPMSVSQMAVSIYAVEKGFLKDVEIDKIMDFEESLQSFMASEYAELMAEIDKTGNYNDDIDAQLKAALEKFKQTQSW